MLLIPLTNSTFLSFTFLIFFFFVFRFSSLSSSNKSIQLVTSSGYVTAILLICMLRFLGCDLTASERETAVSLLTITKRFSILRFSRKFRVGRNRAQVWLKRLKGTRWKLFAACEQFRCALTSPGLRYSLTVLTVFVLVPQLLSKI